jgi:Uma2 family endonuclease
MTAEEFLSLGETDQRLELIDGVVVMSPSPLPLHQHVAFLLMRQISDSLPAGARMFHETDVVLAPRLVYCPDIIAYAPGRLAGFPARLETPPDLIVEVLSPANRKIDLVTKRDDYERHGVGEYWIVEPATAVVTALRRTGASMTSEEIRGEALASHAIPGIRVDLAKVRAEITKLAQ